jgi:hypothetical protein
VLQVGESVDPEDVEDVDSLMHIHRRLDDDDVPELLDLEQVYYMEVACGYGSAALVHAHW